MAARVEVGKTIKQRGCKPVNQASIYALIDLIKQERQERIAGQQKRIETEKQIFEELKAISARNKEVNEVYQDVKRLIGLWKKYGRPLVWFISFVGGACIVVFKLWRLVFPK